MSDVAKTPREELECKKKYLYEYSMFFECNDGSKCQILEDDVCDLLNGQQNTIQSLQDLCGKSDYENVKLRIENKQLRKQQQRLYNYFRNYLEDEMSAENFGEMWDTVKEDERWNE